MIVSDSVPIHLTSNDYILYAKLQYFQAKLSLSIPIHDIKYLCGLQNHENLRVSSSFDEGTPNQLFTITL